MGINRESEESADLQIGPTTSGMVRIYVSSETVDLPMDFSPEDAEEIAQELMAAAETARAMPAQAPASPQKTHPPKRGGPPRPERGKGPRRPGPPPRKRR